MKLGAHVAFFGLIAEMKEPRDFTKALCMLQVFEIVLYTIAAVVIYYYAGESVQSPALGSAGPVLKKVAYGIAIPTVGNNTTHDLMLRTTNLLSRSLALASLTAILG